VTSTAKSMAQDYHVVEIIMNMIIIMFAQIKVMLLQNAAWALYNEVMLHVSNYSCTIGMSMVSPKDAFNSRVFSAHVETPGTSRSKMFWQMPAAHFRLVLWLPENCSPNVLHYVP